MQPQEYIYSTYHRPKGTEQASFSHKTKNIARYFLTDVSYSKSSRVTYHMHLFPIFLLFIYNKEKKKNAFKDGVFS